MMAIILIFGQLQLKIIQNVLIEIKKSINKIFDPYYITYGYYCWIIPILKAILILLIPIINIQVMYYSGSKLKYTPCPSAEIKAVQFCCLTAKQLQTISVAQISESRLFEDSGIPTKNGPFDLRLGVTKMDFACQTCHETRECPGHFGYIKLTQPIYHYGFIKYIDKILKCVCHTCFRVKRSNNPEIIRKFKFAHKIQDPSKRLTFLAKLLGNIGKCSHQQDDKDPYDPHFTSCGSKTPKKIYLRNFQIRTDDKHFCQNKKTKIFQKREVKRILEALSLNNSDCQLLGFTITKPIDLMIELIAVCPPQIRPSIITHSNQRLEDDLTISYSKICRINKELENIKLGQIERNNLIDQIEHIVAAMTVSLNKKSLNSEKGKLSRKKLIFNIKSISDRLKGKQGRFRQNLMGKRVDFSARTVITPDPNILLNELGVPKKIANTLTFPEEVTQMNYDRIIDLCLAGKVKVLLKPPQQCLRNEQRAINMRKIEVFTREQMEKWINYGMIAQRVLQNGDYVLLNRQPTLHRMSMMAHQVRIIPGNSFRLNLSVCPPYNADFDGDQMNIHVPQSYESISELKNISQVSLQILGPKNGAPVMGIVQDGLLGINLLTTRDTFLNREEAMNLLMWIDRDRDLMDKIEAQGLPTPAIIYPQKLWTGKQIISLLIPVQTTIKSIKNKDDVSFSNEINVVIMKGQLLSGTLKKQLVGAGVGSLIHSIWMQSGPQAAANFINNCQRIVNNWLTHNSFTVGASDVVPNQSLAQNIRREKQRVNANFYQILNQYRNANELQEKHLHQKGRRIFDSFQYNINLRLNNRLSKVQELIKQHLSPFQNNIYRIVESKSKGSETNLAQIVYSVGNQNIDGKRCPQGFSKRTLPHFLKEDYSPEVRGYAFSSFIQGLKPHQFFFHSMGGREGLSDTSIKTSHVGYLQRKLTKSLQDIIVKYDGSVRDSKDNWLQKYYGNTGFAVEYTEKHRFQGAEKSIKQFKKMYQWSEKDLKKIYGTNKADFNLMEQQFTRLSQDRQKMRQLHKNSDTIEYICPVKIERIIHKLKKNEQQNDKKQKITPDNVVRNVNRLIEECLQYQKHKAISKNQKLRQQNQRGLQIFRIHLQYNLASKIICFKFCMSKKIFFKLLQQIKHTFVKSLVSAGQAVGSLAAQSIGQPTTQMTLNTFHLAGISDQNVTLGLPRLQQLLHCVKIIKHSTMTVFPKRQILKKDRNIPENQNYLMEILTYHLPQRKLQDFLIKVNYFYDPVPENSKIGFRIRSDILKKRTPWVMKLTFSTKKIGTIKNWVTVLSKVESKLYGIFQVIEHKPFNDLKQWSQDPQISIRLLQFSDVEVLQSSEKKKNSKKQIFSYLERIQSELKLLPICGVDGIKSVKASVKKMKQICQEGPIYSSQKEKQNHQYCAFLTDGSNLRKILSHPFFDSNKSHSNNINEIAEVLGIQAARQVFLNQFKEVLSPYGIQISSTHLSILVDWICVRGSLTPISRTGFNNANDLSILRKASYQQSTKILLKAAVNSQFDHLKGVSQKVVFGQQMKAGTSQCSIHLDPSKIANFVFQPEKDKNYQQEMVMIGNQMQRTPDHSIFYNHVMNESRTLNNSRSFISPLDTSRSFIKNPTFSPLYSPLVSQRQPSPYYKKYGTPSGPTPRYDTLLKKSISPNYLTFQQTQSHTQSQGQNSDVKKQQEDRDDQCDDF